MTLIELLDKLIPVFSVLVGSVIAFFAQHIIYKRGREDRLREILLTKAEEITELSSIALQEAATIPAQISLSLGNGENVDSYSLDWLFADGQALKIATKTHLFFPELANHPLDAASCLTQARKEVLDYNTARSEGDSEVAVFKENFDQALKEYIGHISSLVVGVGEKTKKILPNINT